MAGTYGFTWAQKENYEDFFRLNLIAGTPTVFTIILFMGD